jgi:hypothetical protein
MNKIKLYVHLEGTKLPETIEISSDATVKDLLLLLNKEKFVLADSNYALENDENLLEVSEKNLKEVGIKDKHHLHCHRCHKVSVKISYVSGQVHTFHVRPGTAVGKLIKMSVLEFKIDPTIEPTLIMKNEQQETLDDTTHIGTLVHHPHCSIHLILCPKVIIQG